MTTKPLYLLIKLDVDGEVVFTYNKAATYAKNFCNSMEFELVDHCLEEEDNKDLYIGCLPPESKQDKPMFTLNEDDWP
jgi:hypothetical protein